MDSITGSKCSETKIFHLKLLSIVLRNEGYSMQEIAKKLKISYNDVYYSLHRTVQLALTRIERGVGGPSAQLSKRIITLECLV